MSRLADLSKDLNDRIRVSDLHAWINALVVLTAFVFPISQNWAKTIMTVVFLLWLFTLGDGEKIRFLRKNRVVQTATLFLFILGLSLLWSDDLKSGINYVNRFAIYIYIPLLIVASSIRRETIPLIIKAFIISMLVNELISYSMLFGLIENKAAYPVAFMHHIPYSVLVAFTIMLLGYEIKHSTDIKRTLLYSGFFITMAGNLVISGGRTGQVTLFLTLFFITLLYARLSLRTLVLASILPTLIFITAYFGYEDFNYRVHQAISDTEKALQEQNYNTSFGNRLASYVIAKDILAERSLLFGVGIGDNHAEKNRIIARDYPGQMQIAHDHGHFHNYFIDTVVGTGLIGLGALLAMLVAIYRIRVRDSELTYIKLVVLFIVIIADLPARFLHQQNTMLFFALFIGMVLAQYRIENTLQSKQDD
ncbi:MAG: O-antigen ligase family protein [Gammaproteobacteria bacterium]|nr:O-antigen ligase family protein [Gammaproteobacteria bacterium]